VSRDGASLPFPSKWPRTSAGSAKLALPGMCLRKGRGKEGALAGHGSRCSPILALGRRYCCSLTKGNLNWRA